MSGLKREKGKTNFKKIKFFLITEVTYVFCRKIGPSYKQMYLPPSFFLCTSMCVCLNYLHVTVMCNIHIWYSLGLKFYFITFSPLINFLLEHPFYHTVPSDTYRKIYVRSSFSLLYIML